MHVFTSAVPNFFSDFAHADASTPAALTKSLETKSYLRGQNYHLLGGVTSLPTDSEGHASWSNLTLLASSSKFLYLYFYCEGVVLSWNDPFQRPVRAAAFVRPPRFVRPIYVFSSVRRLKQLESTPAESGLESTPPPPPANGVPFAEASSATASVVDPIVCPEDAVVCAEEETELECAERRAAAIRTVVEGDPLNETLRVQLLGGHGGREYPIVGERVLAVVEQAMGRGLPLLLRPDMKRLWEYQASSSTLTFNPDPDPDSDPDPNPNSNPNPGHISSER